MKILILFISVFFLSISTCLSQPYCTWQNPLPTRSGLNDIYFSDSLNGYSVGLNGTVLKTTNSGYNWSSINYYKSINLSSVSFLNSSTGIIVGSEYYTSGGGGLRSEIIRTTNGGINWVVVDTASIRQLSKVYFINQNTGFIVSGDFYGVKYILKTTNAGINWTTINIPFYLSANGISFLNNNEGVICGTGGLLSLEGGKIVKTSDGGNTWNVIKSDNKYYNDITYLGQDTIIAIGYDGVCIKSINGGITWDSIPLGSLGTLYDINFINNYTGYIAGGAIYKTTNGGSNWDSVSPNIMAKKIIKNSQTRYYSLATTNWSGQIHRSTDSGFNWQHIYDFSTLQGLRDVFMINNYTGYAAGNGGTLLKTNDGNNWSTVTFPYSNTIYSVYFINSSTGFLGCNQAKIFKTSNEGSNWTPSVFDPPLYNFDIYSIAFVNLNTGFLSCWYYNPMGGYWGRVYKSTNQGNTWFISLNLQYHKVGPVFFINENTGYCSVDSASLLKTTNCGLNWNTYAVPTIGTSSIRQIYFLNESTGFIANSNNILRTTNGGINWAYVYNFSMDPGKIQFTDNLHGFFCNTFYPAAGRSGDLVRTTNGGLNWYSFSNSLTAPFLAGSGLTSLSFINNNTGYISGEEGVLLKTTNGGGSFIGITKNENILPDRYLLHQNYPNPFNPTTKIKFDVMRLGNFKIVVFDITGRVIQTLVHENLKPGIYETSFNGSQLASGVYFYRMTTESFSETKRMVLIK